MNKEENKKPGNTSSGKVDKNSKNRQLEDFRNDNKDQYLTTNQGLRINHNDDSLTAGYECPIR